MTQKSMKDNNLRRSKIMSMVAVRVGRFSNIADSRFTAQRNKFFCFLLFYFGYILYGVCALLIRVKSLTERIEKCFIDSLRHIDSEKVYLSCPCLGIIGKLS